MNFKPFVRFGDKPDFAAERFGAPRHPRKPEALFQLVDIDALLIFLMQ